MRTPLIGTGCPNGWIYLELGVHLLALSQTCRGPREIHSTSSGLTYQYGFPDDEFVKVINVS